MIRTVALWGAELGWKGQKDWKRGMERLQYQALKKSMGAVQGSSMEKVNKIPGVEEVDTIMRASQARFVARSMADPSGVGDMWPKSARPENGEDGEGGRDWRDKSVRWMPEEHKGRDGYTSTASRMMAQLGLEENEELS